MDNSLTLHIPMFATPKRITYYSLELRAERCPTWDLHYAFEHFEVMLSPALRPCDLRNGKMIMLLDKHLAEELASYAEPVMQQRYGVCTEVHIVECSCPEKMAKPLPFDAHRKKVQQLLVKFEAKKVPRTQLPKVALPPKETATLFRLPVRDL
ncbi:TPA: hypothetical protein ACKP6A_005884 [Pseudomonas aeruginosa]|uniref:hypothetical protein n=1 Tax=Pseudomonas aeruginosa TaxID=287 RepID=UPI0003B9A58A|nr:hypothetical protein [Pseudomonas aeruginosa]KEA14429.1 hypothetical protein Y905_25720 [Pseudomonas aeruginosa C2159M]ERY84276.1 hypothetical protein Q028_00876 [Pseudomonas aeruginosa BWHPSA015]KEI24508.1 hypothetical protein CH80_29405 [Pseudomonas aeruginosa]KQC50258.1 hypothetical protein APG04_20600 [Pseudomonas aeruginosa]KQC56110.1 hypothetical protein APG03_25410 [Pseudomonas aeruginosa]